MERSRLVAMGGAGIGLGVLALWAMQLGAPPAEDPVLAAIEQERSAPDRRDVGQEAPPDGVLEVIERPEVAERPEHLDALDEEDDEPLFTLCFLPEVPLSPGASARATASSGPGSLALDAEVRDGGVQVGDLRDLRQRLADVGRSAVSGALDLELVVTGAGRWKAKLLGGGDVWWCQVQGEDSKAWVEGRVTTGFGLEERRVLVDVCGRRNRVKPDGSFRVEIDADDTPCLARAFRRDGPYLVRSEAVEVAPSAGATERVSLSLPDERRGGVGVRIRPHDRGIRILKVNDDSPAGDAGLRPGDVVTRVDDRSAVEMSLRQFVDAAVGPEGTEVVYTVLRDGQEQDIVMVRETAGR